VELSFTNIKQNKIAFFSFYNNLCECVVITENLIFCWLRFKIGEGEIKHFKEKSSISHKSNQVSERETLKNIKKSVVKNFLDSLILMKLRKDGSFNGYEMMRVLQEKYDLMISPSTVYSALYLLERRNLVRGETIGNVRVYSLTEEGFAVTEIIISHQEKITSYVSMCLFG
jgi:DNA-binding PadR family transcriptional regulator